jgi:hypothetical protein
MCFEELSHGEIAGDEMLLELSGVIDGFVIENTEG